MFRSQANSSSDLFPTTCVAEKSYSLWQTQLSVENELECIPRRPCSPKDFIWGHSPAEVSRVSVHPLTGLSYSQSWAKEPGLGRTWGSQVALTAGTRPSEPPCLPWSWALFHSQAHKSDEKQILVCSICCSSPSLESCCSWPLLLNPGA